MMVRDGWADRSAEIDPGCSISRSSSFTVCLLSDSIMPRRSCETIAAVTE
jgi:hypothetical protein